MGSLVPAILRALPPLVLLGVAYSVEGQTEIVLQADTVCWLFHIGRKYAYAKTEAALANPNTTHRGRRHAKGELRAMVKKETSKC